MAVIGHGSSVCHSFSENEALVDHVATILHWNNNTSEEEQLEGVLGAPADISGGALA